MALPFPARAACLALALACLVGTLAGTPAEARRSASAPRPAEAEAEPAGAWTAGVAQAPTCSRTRRKLWQADEGWVVKTISTCR
ncbi:hypothetical protein [Methylobacterium trifolii]|uniref:Uncharacterized protein n=1 Tax=Methylobacterium trifolii TaxID=1003092 RepID=A0ABQ4TUR7_9HYPH|nr:hypothetical protein [Methylobacterium trifolii]GJE58975.1 hypothetical protein MPOCJGCO_1061 [Methylobacterium trifolii]